MLRQKERELTTTLSAIKSARTQSELLRRQKLNTDTSAMGYDKMNELVAKLREHQTQNDKLTTDVKSYHRINGQQNKELESIDAVKNFPGKLQQLTKELRVVNKANREMHGELNAIMHTQKQLRNAETRLEDRQREVLNRQKLQNGQGPAQAAASANRMTPVIASRPNQELLMDPHARRKRQLGKLSQQ